MEQDLFSWLNSQKKLQETSLLVVPLGSETQGDTATLGENNLTQISENENQVTEHAAESEHENSADYIYMDSDGNFHIAEPESSQEDFSSQPQNYAGDFQAPQSESSSQPELSAEPQNYVSDFQTPQPESSQPESPQEDLSVYIQPDLPSDETQYDDDITQGIPPEALSYGDDEPDEIPQDHDWQERATGFTLSLDEPPPELWLNINDDDPDPEYEPTDSLQGAAYVQIHGRNFTERLHHTLKHRKERAEERAKSESENDTQNPLKNMAVILCSTLVMVLGFVWLALWFVGRETPEGMKSRASSLAEQGQYDEASSIYQRAYRRYPNDPEILAGLSSSAEKAGHTQTAKAARDEYEKNFHGTAGKDTEPVKESAPENKSASENKPVPENKPESRKEIIIPVTNKKPATFHDYITEGNHFYNIGMYSKAALNFFRAIEINGRDLRAYIGLANSYRMKGMYFDSWRILNEARRLFGGSPALDMSLYFLRRDINGR